ncbi:hypothetical protein WICPIJ_000817 [Wickerhamomyces pijperi]|uniref:Uncharacterized protein n=1 Tax=Wickerhamomyces pijperi TaxID=599730 RepID=A0A9P8TRD4_WICPI|nr:hypothetical protein WICPIJ_000817 [Wickerhamomyces pijperi]
MYNFFWNSESYLSLNSSRVKLALRAEFIATSGCMMIGSLDKAVDPRIEESFGTSLHPKTERSRFLASCSKVSLDCLRTLSSFLKNKLPMAYCPSAGIVRFNKCLNSLAKKSWPIDIKIPAPSPLPSEETAPLCVMLHSKNLASETIL